MTQGTGNLNASSDSVEVKQSTGTNLHAVIDSGTITTVSTVTSLTQMNGQAIQMGTGARTAGTQRVTIATDDLVPVSDNGGSLTVDNAGTFAVQATVAASATNIAKAEDAASADADVGVPAMAIRKASPANTSGTDGDYEMLQMSAGRLWASATIDAAIPAGANVIGHVISDSGSTTAVTQATASNLNAQVVGAAASGASKSGNPVQIGGVFNTTQPTVTTGQAVEAQLTARGGQIVATGVDTFNVTVNAALPAGTNAIGKLSANSGVIIGDMNVVSDIPGTGATNLGKAEDAAHSSGDTGVSILGRRIDTAASSAGTSGDYATIDTSAEGAVWGTLTPTTTSGLSVANFNTGDTYTALTNTAQVIKASAGNLYGYFIYNPNATAAYVMIYNIASASVTVGTSTAQMVFAIPAGAAANLMMAYPISFSNAGWSIAAATTGGGNTAPATALEVMIWYK